MTARAHSCAHKQPKHDAIGLNAIRAARRKGQSASARRSSLTARSYGSKRALSSKTSTQPPAPPLRFYDTRQVSQCMRTTLPLQTPHLLSDRSCKQVEFFSGRRERMFPHAFHCPAQAGTNYPVGSSMPTFGPGDCAVLRLPGRSANRPVGRPIGGPIGRSVGRPAGRSEGRPVGQSVGRPVGRSVGQSANRSAGRPTGRAVGRLADHLLGQSAGRSVGWPVGRSVSRSVGRRVGRSADRLVGL